MLAFRGRWRAVCCGAFRDGRRAGATDAAMMTDRAQAWLVIAGLLAMAAALALLAFL